MGEIQRQVFFKASVEKVWKVWTDVEKTTEWVEGVQESKITSDAREGKGLAWKEKCLFGKKNVIQMDHEMTEWEPLKKTVIQTGLPMGGTMERKAEFKSTSEGTEVLMQMEWDLGIAGAIIGDDKLQHMMEKSFDLTVEKWKSKAESDT